MHNVSVVQRRSDFSTLEGKSKVFPKKYQKSTTFHALWCVLQRITLLSFIFVNIHYLLGKSVESYGITVQNKWIKVKKIKN
jgi:hypothetical protein